MESLKTEYINTLKSSMMNRLVNEKSSSLIDCYHHLQNEIMNSSEKNSEKETEIEKLTAAFQYVQKELHKFEQFE